MPASGRPIVQGTSILYLALAHLLNIDMGVSVLMSATLFCFILAICEERGRPATLLFLGMYAAAALATLSKGLIGFLLPGAVMFLWLLVLREWKWLRPFYLVAGLVLFLAIAVPWHLLVARANPGWAHFYFIHEHFERFTDKGHGRYQPDWYFIPILILGLFPWTGFVWSAFRAALGRRLVLPRREHKGLVPRHLGGFHLRLFQPLKVQASQLYPASLSADRADDRLLVFRDPEIARRFCQDAAGTADLRLPLRPDRGGSLRGGAEARPDPGARAGRRAQALRLCPRRHPVHRRMARARARAADRDPRGARSPR